MLKCFSACLFLALSGALHAQARPTATRLAEAQIGGTYVDGQADYTLSRFDGFGLYADLDLRHHLGIEAEYHYITDLDPYLIAESTYEVGGRYSRHYGRLQPYAKFLLGRGVFNLQNNTNAYNLYAAGIGADIRVTGRINVRVEYELQKWLPGSGPGATVIPNGLTPRLPAIGIAYRFK